MEKGRSFQGHEGTVQNLRTVFTDKQLIELLKLHFLGLHLDLLNRLPGAGLRNLHFNKFLR